MTGEKRHRLKTCLIVANLLCSVLLLTFMIGFAFSSPSETEFKIDARLSTLSVVTSEGQPAWPASIPIRPTPPNCVTPSFRPATDSTIVFTQLGNAPLAISVTAGKAGLSTGEFTCKGGTVRPGAAYLEATLDTAATARAQRAISAKTDAKGGKRSKTEEQDFRLQPFSIRFVGAVTAGSEIADLDPVPLLLESGEITMETVPLFGSSERVESKYQLNKGDVVNFTFNQLDEPLAKSVTFGFISDDGPGSAQPGFHLIARTQASRAMILPYGRAQAGEVAVAPDFFARARAGAKGILLGAIGALALHVLTLILAMIDHQPLIAKRNQ